MPPVLTSAAVVGATESRRLFDAAYGEHARRLAATLATGSHEGGVDRGRGEHVIGGQHRGTDDAGEIAGRRGHDAELGRGQRE